MVETYVMLKPEHEWREGSQCSRRLGGNQPRRNAAGRYTRVCLATHRRSCRDAAVRNQSPDGDPHLRRRLENVSVGRHGYVASQLKKSPYINPGSSQSRTSCLGKPYIEFTVDREAASRYGMSASMVNQVIETALGGMNLITTVEGRQRYPVRIRYNRDLRERIDGMSRLPVVTHSWRGRSSRRTRDAGNDLGTGCDQ